MVVNKMLTAPLYALSRPIKKFRLSSSPKDTRKLTEAQNRLYERSKKIHHKLKTDKLRFLTSMMKELNQNYDMFEKPGEVVNEAKPSENAKNTVNQTDTMSSISKVASPRPLSVECPSPTINERTSNHNMSTESPGVDSSRISGLAKRIEGAKGITKAN